MNSLARGLAVLALAAPAVATSASAGNHDAKPVGPACYVWKLQEVCYTVYEVKSEPKEVTVKEPVIKKLTRPMYVPTCEPVARKALRPVCGPNYKQTKYPVEETICHKREDACGETTETPELCVHPATCVEKSKLVLQVPSLEWSLVPSEREYTQTYFIRECVDKKVTVNVPVLKPKTVTRKVWVKVPYCPDSCDSCKKGS